MKKLFFLVFLFICFQSFGQNRFPSIDSAKNYTLRYIRNSTVEAFTNLRMQNVTYGTLQLLDSLAGAGVVDTIFKSGDTLKYKIGSTTFTVGVFGGGGSTDSTIFATQFRLDSTRNGIRADLNTKQATLVSGTNIKTINGTSLLGSGDITVGGTVTSASGTGTSLVNGSSQIKRLKAGVGISITDNTDSVTIAYSGGNNVDSTAARIRRGTFAQRPAAPDTGQIYFQTDRLAGMWIYDGAQWRFKGDPLNYSHHEQFSNGSINVPRLSGLASGAGSGGTVLESLGVGSYAVLSTGTTSTGYASYGFNAASTFVLTLDSMIQYREERVRIPVLGTAGENFNVAVGWLGHQSTWTFGSALFWYNYGSGGGVWQTFTRKYDNSGNMTYKVSAVTVAANQWYRLAILMNGYTQEVQFFIDDVLVQTHSTALGDNIPMPGNTAVGSQYNFGITKLAGTTSRTIEIDHSFLYYVKRKYQ